MIKAIDSRINKLEKATGLSSDNELCLVLGEGDPEINSKLYALANLPLLEAEKEYKAKHGGYLFRLCYYDEQEGCIMTSAEDQVRINYEQIRQKAQA